MVLTVLEARVSGDRIPDLRRAFEETSRLPVPPFIVRSLLLQSTQDPQVWRIMTLFRSRDELNAMRSSGETPRGVAMFQAAGAEPILSIFDVADQIPRDATSDR